MNAAVLKPTLDVATLLSYDDVTTDAATNTFTVHELSWIAEKNKSADLTATLPVATTKWYAAATGAEITKYVTQWWPSYYLTASTSFVAITNNAERRDKINDMLTVANRWW